jgi:superfamily II DNA/RNA helicase
LLQRLVQHGPAVSSNRARVLVLVPTRELAEQVLQSFVEYGKGLTCAFWPRTAASASTRR